MRTSRPRPVLARCAWAMMRSSSAARPTKSCWTTRPRTRRKFSLRLLISTQSLDRIYKIVSDLHVHPEKSCKSCLITTLPFMLTIEFNPIFPQTLCLVQRAIRRSDDVLRRVDVLRKRRHTNTDRNVPERLRFPVRKFRCRNTMPDTVGNRASLDHSGLRQQNAKLLTTVTRRNIDCP